MVISTSRFFVPGKRMGAEYMKEAFKAGIWWLGKLHCRLCYHQPSCRYHAIPCHGWCCFEYHLIGVLSIFAASWSPFMNRTLRLTISLTLCLPCIVYQNNTDNRIHLVYLISYVIPSHIIYHIVLDLTVFSHRISRLTSPPRPQAWDEDNSGWIDTGELRRVLKADG